MKRVPMPKKGGKLASENRIARYVEPHTNQVAARHATMKGVRLLTPGIDTATPECRATNVA
jgi:hypothetical protein